MKSIELLKKAEKLALMYDSEDGFWLGFSGGKDSQALIHIAQLADVKFKARFSPTSVDPPETIRFICQQYPEVEFLPIEKSIYQEFLERKCLPSMRIRWCCSVFKENKAPNKVTLVGVRHAESARRARRNSVEVSNHKFSGNIDEFSQWSETAKAKKIRAAKNKAKKLHQLDQWDEHKEQMVNCINGKDQIIISPIIEWTDNDVWEFLNNVVRVPHCELYDKGRHRIGCILCPMASIKNTLRDIKEYPYVKEKWIKAIMEVRRQSFESEGFTPPNSTFTNTRSIGSKFLSPSVQPKEKWTTGGYKRYLSPTTYRNLERKFLDSTNEQGAAVSAENKAPFYDIELEREVAENILDWWISKKSYKQWYSEKYLQQKLDFNEQKDKGNDTE